LPTLIWTPKCQKLSAFVELLISKVAETSRIQPLFMEAKYLKIILVVLTAKESCINTKT
jgi:hypothetical protein